MDDRWSIRFEDNAWRGLALQTKLRKFRVIIEHPSSPCPMHEIVGDNKEDLLKAANDWIREQEKAFHERRKKI